MLLSSIFDYWRKQKAMKFKDKINDKFLVILAISLYLIGYLIDNWERFLGGVADGLKDIIG